MLICCARNIIIIIVFIIINDETVVLLNIFVETIFLIFDRKTDESLKNIYLTQKYFVWIWKSLLSLLINLMHSCSIKVLISLKKIARTT